MNISHDTKNVINTLENYSKTGLRKKNDLEIIFEICASFNQVESLSNLIFNGKIFWNLSRKLPTLNISDESTANFKKEFEHYLELIKDELVKLIEIADDEVAYKRFQETYFSLTRGCVLNLIDLSHDFSRFKEMQKDHKS